MTETVLDGIVVLGASWGGLGAVGLVLEALPGGFPCAVTVVQHRSPDSDQTLAELLQDRSTLPVLEVEDKEPIDPGRVYVAPANYHLLVEGGHFALTTDAPVRYSRPSIDVTFSALADAFGAGVLGVVLTGANEDGAAGLRRIVDRGGRALVQEPRTAEVATMPRAALARVPEATVLPLPDIGEWIVRHAPRMPGRGTR